MNTNANTINSNIEMSSNGNFTNKISNGFKQTYAQKLDRLIGNM